ncbi:hypothetical protein C2I36_08870 [Rhodobacteraceae bacterium WD3A24]|nr:hypothetical protein C2I36_08870 [Rhodobacteraceae bacterium WD3A24]
MAGQRSALNTLGGWLAVLAIAGGLFYVLYVISWSGDTVARIELAPQGRSEELPVALSPEMDPVRGVLGLEYSGRLGGRIATYDVAIGGDEDVDIKDIFTESGIANDPSDESGRSSRVRGHSVNLGTFEVPVDAGYLVRADIEPSSRVDLESATLSLTANSAEWDLRIIGGLGLALILGLGMGMAGRGGKAG